MRHRQDGYENEDEGDPLVRNVLGWELRTEDETIRMENHLSACFLVCPMLG